jgi:RNA polymerase sigma-70 factor (ECF subfamily)
MTEPQKWLERVRRLPDGEDILQEAWALVLAYSQHHDVKNLYALLNRTVRHLLADRFRRRARHPHVSAEAMNVAGLISDPAPGPDEVLDGELRLRETKKALLAGGASELTCNVFFATQGIYTYKEVAARLGVSVSAVEKRVARALRILERSGLSKDPP